MTFNRSVARLNDRNPCVLIICMQVYSAYMSHFQLHNILWYAPPTNTHIELELRCRYEKTWGHLFETFDLFLSCSWPVIVVTDVWTSKAHIVTKSTHIQSFIKMIRTRWVLYYIPT